jgi:hypothetical protein
MHGRRGGRAQACRGVERRSGRRGVQSFDECVMCECVCVTQSAPRRAMACRWRVMVEHCRREARRQQRRRAWPRGRTRGAARRPRVRARGVQCASCASAAEPGAVWCPAGACGRRASDCSECERVRVMHVWTRCAQRRRCRVGHVAEPPTVGRGMRTARRANVEGSTRGPPAVRRGQRRQRVERLGNVRRCVRWWVARRHAHRRVRGCVRRLRVGAAR